MIPFVDQMDLKGRRVLLRLDLNVPLSKKDGTISDETRIQEAIPTIQYCLENAKRLIVCSHLGRPDGRSDLKYSLEPVAHRLRELLKCDVILLDDCIGEGIHQMVTHHQGNEVFLLENLRFHKEEEENDPNFAHELAHLADAYVTDAFGTAHRKHASTYGVPEIMPLRGAGFLIKKELQYLSQLIHKPEHPFVLVAGGAKVSDKLKPIENLINHVDSIIIGGAMAYAFLAAKNISIGRSKCEIAGVEAAKTIMKRAEQHGIKLLLPEDHIVVYPDKDPDFIHPERIDSPHIPHDAMALDIGPKTIAKFTQGLGNAKTIFWNGPMGFFEKEKFSKGSEELAKAVGALAALKVVGGGDTVSAVKQFRLEGSFDLLSTGGGASLEFLEGKGLPGLKVLEKKHA